ncbi:hypothetical protein IWX49DRAFT_368605 [Phyllosticta citricarpa]|uniref:Secreted protein n=2 Tax=Phyllosticta TaxID=121621 RepID=A0ABR1MJ26_9PEZI
MSPVFLPASRPACLPAGVFAFLPACILACLPALPSARPSPGNSLFLLIWVSARRPAGLLFRGLAFRPFRLLVCDSPCLLLIHHPAFRHLCFPFRGSAFRLASGLASPPAAAPVTVRNCPFVSASAALPTRRSDLWGLRPSLSPYRPSHSATSEMHSPPHTERVRFSR